jgi:hypothetical protein
VIESIADFLIGADLLAYQIDSRVIFHYGYSLPGIDVVAYHRR